MLFCTLRRATVQHIKEVDRHRGSGCPLPPATPPCITGPYTAVRLVRLTLLDQ